MCHLNGKEALESRRCRAEAPRPARGAEKGCILLAGLCCCCCFTEADLPLRVRNSWEESPGKGDGERLKGQSRKKGRDERILYCKYIAGIKTIRFFVKCGLDFGGVSSLKEQCWGSKEIRKRVPLFITNVSSRTRESCLPCFRCRQLSFLDLYLQKIVSLTNFYWRGFWTFQICSSTTSSGPVCFTFYGSYTSCFYWCSTSDLTFNERKRGNK